MYYVCMYVCMYVHVRICVYMYSGTCWITYVCMYASVYALCLSVIHIPLFAAPRRAVALVLSIALTLAPLERRYSKTGN